MRRNPQLINETHADHLVPAYQSAHAQDLIRQRLLIEQTVERLIDVLDQLDLTTEGLEPDVDLEELPISVCCMG